jgi:hypothetical protein
MNNINSFNNGEQTSENSQLAKEETRLNESDSEEKEEIIDEYFDMGLISYEGFIYLSRIDLE